jgi:GntR family transcriptional regulator, carbon starvation induced regulator
MPDTIPPSSTGSTSNGSRPETLASLTYRRLRSDMLTGGLRPGEKLRIELVAQRYDVGASPVREALSRLSAESFVERHDQRGFRVAPVSMEELIELTRTRCLLNEVTLRESIERGDSDWEDQIVLASHRLRRMPSKLDSGLPNFDWDHQHKSLHSALIAACDSRWLTALAETLFDCADRYRYLSMDAGALMRDSNAEHQAIVDATLDRDAPTAVALLNKHVSATVELIKKNPEALLGAESGKTKRGKSSQS